MKHVITALRIIVGLLFIFSGLVKANDPLGLAYKMNEFFEAWHMGQLVHYSLSFSLFMIVCEVLGGMAIILGYKFRIFSFLFLLLNAFFTFLTAYVLYSGKIKECGCFGDCIKISNTNTFLKDIVLLVIAIVFFVYRRSVRPLLSKYTSISLLILTIFIASAIQWWVLEHLPFYDCLAYKVGTNITEKMQPPAHCVQDSFSIVFIYKHDGKNIKVPMDSVKNIDSTWEYVDRKDEKIREGNCNSEIKDFKLTGYDDTTDQTANILTTPGYTFFFVIKDAGSARPDNMERIQNIFKQSLSQNIPMYGLSSMDKAATTSFQTKWHLEGLPFLQLDGTASKAMIRTNPGLMLIEQGTIRGKWSFRDYPKSIEEAKRKIKK